MHRRSSVRDAGRRASPAFPPPPPYDLQASHSVVSIEGDPSRPTGRMVFLDGHESSYVDLADPTHRQVVSAAGGGCKAAIDAERWLGSKGIH